MLDSIGSQPEGTWRRYFQTQYELPAGSGLSSRVPFSTIEAEARIRVSAERGEWSHLCQDLGFRYVLLASTDALPASLAARLPLLAGDGFQLIDLGQQTYIVLP